MKSGRVPERNRAAATDLDRRKARIVASLYPTRIKRGFTGGKVAAEVAQRIGVSVWTLYAWEAGESLPRDEQVALVEAWLAEGPVWRYAGIDRVVGPEKFSLPAPMGAKKARKYVRAAIGALNERQAASRRPSRR